jgi:hypothetical protein
MNSKRVYIGFDDTDAIDAGRGTGKLARWFGEKLPGGCKLFGVLRFQLPKMDGIPFTSHNSSACVIAEACEPMSIENLADMASAHIQEHFIQGSDPGLCITMDDTKEKNDLINFGRTCCQRIVTQKEAMNAAGSVHLSGHGGTNDGIIGAAAGVGLAMYGWAGRFIEFGNLRSYPKDIKVSVLEENNILVLPVERDSLLPSFDDTVQTGGWLRPRFWGGRAVLPVNRVADNLWKAVDYKEKEPKV